MVHQVYFLVLSFIYSINQAASEVYHITTDSESAPTDLCTAQCLTLSEFTASLSHYLSSNNTLVFLPGTHYLTVNVSVSNLNQFSMFSESITAQIVCKNYSHIHFSHIQFISISNLEFIECGGNQLEYVKEFIVKDAKFEGQNSSSTALEIIETATQIVNSTFSEFIGGKFRLSLHSFVGGAIIATGRVINISQSRFENNGAEKGGAIYAEQYSIIIINNSTFENNGAEFGGAINAKYSILMIKNSRFTKNFADIFGGVLFSLKNFVKITASNFDINKTRLKGGVVASVQSRITIETSEFCNNRANTGVLASWQSNTKIKKSKFDLKTAISRGRTSSGGVIYSIVSNIIIETSKFDGNKATSRKNISSGGVLYCYESNVTVKASKFDGNTAISRGDRIRLSGGGVLHSRMCTVTIETSEFDNNIAIGYIYRNSGGVLLSHYSSIALKANKFNCNTARRGGVLFCLRCHITIASKFYNNSAITCGILLCISSTITIEAERVAAVANETDFNDGNNVTNNTEGAVAYTNLKDMNGSLQVVDNRARYGVIYLKNSKLNVKYSGSLTLSNNVGSLIAESSKIIFIGSVEFRNNSQGLLQISEGGAITLIHSEIYFNGSCNLHHNLAEDGGGLLSIESKLYVNSDVTIAHNTASSNGGGVYLSANSELNCQEKSTFLLINNYAGQKGGGLHAISSSIKAVSVWNTSTEARLNFTKNIANMGGGLSLDANAKLYILKYNYYYDEVTHIIYTVTVAFTDNSADTYGGAVYVDDDTNSGTCTDSSKMECFFQVLGVSKYGIPQNTRSLLYFTQNYANISGSTLYGGLLDRCTLSIMAEIHSKSMYMWYFDRDAYSISSGPVKVCLCTEKTYNCSYQLLAYKVKKGEAFNVSLVAVDQIEQPVNAIIHASLKFPQSGLSEGQLTTEIQRECTNLTFNVVSPHNDEELTLYASDGPCKDADLSKRVIKIDFLPCSCPIGFQESGKVTINCTCDCHSNISQYTERCDSQTESFVKKSRPRAWISYINDMYNLTGYLVYQNCPYDYCSSLSLPINLNQLNGADAQCAFNRSSLLCGNCRSGLSLSLGSSRCLPCPGYWPALLLVITISAILAGIVLVAFLLLLNMTVAVGTLNGLIFYANIVHASRSVLLPFQETSAVTVLVSWLNLELGINACYFPTMDTYVKIWLQLAFPVYIILLVVLVIVISSYSMKFSKLIGKKDPVATLATLILLSYTKILEICFESLSAGTLRYPDGTKIQLWLPDATVKYLTGKHMPLFVLAVLILLVGLIYTVLLFSWQWLLCLPDWKIFKWTRDQKLQTFIETHHIPFTPKYRYWTGLLLIARVILYLIGAANVANDPQLVLSSIILTTSFILVIRAFIQSRVYRKSLINILDAFFFLNLVLFSVLTWFSLSNPDISQKAVVNISVLSSFFVMLLIILYHVYTYTIVFSILKKTRPFRMAHTLLTRSDQGARRHLSLPPDDDIHRFNEILDVIDRPVNSDDYKVPLLNLRKPARPIQVAVAAEVHQLYVPPLEPEKVKAQDKSSPADEAQISIGEYDKLSKV